MDQGYPLKTFPDNSAAIVVGARGGIGCALTEALTREPHFTRVIGLYRTSQPTIDIADERSIAEAAREIASQGLDLRLVINATGFLHDAEFRPEKTWNELDPEHMRKAFEINTIGPALLMKHFLPLLASAGKATFATLSAKLGSIGDNHVGGWYSYRASKAALNQLVRTASIELRRRRSEAVCVALHPGTVDTGLSAPFSKSGLDVQSPAIAARRLLNVIDNLSASDSGGFFSYRGEPLPW